MDIKNKFQKLDSIRAFAAVYVTLGHVFAQNLKFGKFDFGIIFRFGQEAVIIFFILSGFVINYSFTLSDDKTLKTFFFKRFFRIYIPLIFIYILSVILNYLYTHEFSINLYQLLGNIFMLQDINILKENVIVSPFLGNLPLWSLSYEWYFYFIYFF
jgi:peptidoglycan/LPS O-acetylase OafA/YrhL